MSYQQYIGNLRSNAAGVKFNRRPLIRLTETSVAGSVSSLLPVPLRTYADNIS